MVPFRGWPGALPQFFSPIYPIGIFCFHKPILFISFPTLQLFFTGDCIVDLGLLLKIYQPVDMILFRKPFNLLDLMFVQSSSQIVSYTDVHYGVGLIG